jgi:hypothetical protein
VGRNDNALGSISSSNSLNNLKKHQITNQSDLDLNAYGRLATFEKLDLAIIFIRMNRDFLIIFLYT